MAKAEIKENVEVEHTPEQKSFQAHIQSLTSKISRHQFEIDELMPSLNMYQEALAESMKQQVNNNPKENKNDDT
tara:strand:- start:37 stop:258 length:222 start_codon:yes stop_codon:yes gene_type:complete